MGGGGGLGDTSGGGGGLGDTSVEGCASADCGCSCLDRDKDGGEEGEGVAFLLLSFAAGFDRTTMIRLGFLISPRGELHGVEGDFDVGEDVESFCWLDARETVGGEAAGVGVGVGAAAAATALLKKRRMSSSEEEEHSAS